MSASGIMREISDAFARLADEIDGVQSSGGARVRNSSGESSGGAVADARELDSQYGDPPVFKDPSKWQGPSYEGVPYSKCPSDYLMMLAGLLDWMADKDAGSDIEKKRKAAGYKRKDAARARGWARRNEGKQMSAPKRPERPPPEDSGLTDDAPDDTGDSSGGGGDMDDIPFGPLGDI